MPAQRHTEATHPLAWREGDWRGYLQSRGFSVQHAGQLLSDYAGSRARPAGSALPAGLRRQLRRDFPKPELPLSLRERARADDGVIKWTLATSEGHPVECVYIPHKGRGTACLSSQAGCGYGCRFCATASMGLARNLSASEIIAQLRLMRQELKSLDCKASIDNAVFMGMGEPLANLDNLVDAIELMACDKAYAIARRRITVSTVGLADRIVELAQATKANLAVSLHAPNDELRTRLMPVNRRWPLAKLMAACREFAQLRRGSSITIEYLMLDGVNDSPACARQLAGLLGDLPAKVNLIPFNAHAGSGFFCSPPVAIDAFGDILRRAGRFVSVRLSRGADQAAACGQLAAAGLAATH